MRNFKGILVLAMAVALVFGAATMAKADSWPDADITSLANWLTSKGASYSSVSGFELTTSTWLATALAYEASWTTFFNGLDQTTAPFANNGYTVEAFGDWVNIGDVMDSFFYTYPTSDPAFESDFDNAAAWGTDGYLELYVLDEDWYYADLDQWFAAGTYILGFDDGGSGPDDNHDDIIMAFKPVPVPAAVWLLGSGLIGLAGLRRKFKN